MVLTKNFVQLGKMYLKYYSQFIIDDPTAGPHTLSTFAKPKKTPIDQGLLN